MAPLGKSTAENGVSVEVKKLEISNGRSVCGKVDINASFDSVWKIITDYENYVKIIPNLVDSKLLDKKDNCVRVCQTSQQNILLKKLTVKIVFDYYEEEVEITNSGKKRNVKFKVIESDIIQTMEGKWSLEQFTEPGNETRLSYIMDVVKTKSWLPISIVEGKLFSNIRTNLSSIRAAAETNNSGQ